MYNMCSSFIVWLLHIIWSFIAFDTVLYWIMFFSIQIHKDYHIVDIPLCKCTSTNYPPWVIPNHTVPAWDDTLTHKEKVSSCTDLKIWKISRKINKQINSLYMFLRANVWHFLSVLHVIDLQTQFKNNSRFSDESTWDVSHQH